MADAVDDDTLAAVEALWKTDVAGLAALFPRGLETGRLKATPQRPLALPYAQAACAKGPPAQRYTGGARKDCRKVTITLRGVKADVVKGMGLALALFSAQMGRPAVGASLAVPGLAYPSGAKFVRWWPLNDGELAQEEQTKEGLDVWRGVIEAEVRSVRLD